MSTKDNISRERTLTMFQHAMGPDILKFMHDPKIFEIMLNPDGTLWVDTFDRGCIDTGIHMDANQATLLINSVAALTGQVINKEILPALQAEIPDSHLCDSARFQGELPNIVSAPSFNIRKHPKVILTLDDYVKNEIMTAEQYNYLLTAIQSEKNIIAAGGTKSGKTTLLNAILQEISKYNDRIVLIEDTPELRCNAKNNVSLRTTEHVDMDMLLRFTLRKSPNRIVVGEVRGKEALTLLDSWSTGHRGGCSTVHSDSAVDTLYRLEGLVSRTSATPQHETVGRAIDVIIYVKYHGGKRKIQDIIEVEKYDPLKKEYIYRKV